MANRRVTLTVYTAAHFAVDLGCGWLVMALLAMRGQQPMKFGGEVILLYNFLAFGMQFIIGWLTDTARDRGRMWHQYVAFVGCLCVSAALIAGARTPWLSVTLTGLGNAAFHVGGGIDALLFAHGKMGRGGIFVSSGAVGVALGMLLGGTLHGMLYIPAALTGVCALLVLLFGRCREDIVLPSESGQTPPMSAGACGLLLCLFAVLVRSWAGFLFSMPWKQGFWLILLAAVASAVGKAAGGILADRLGARTVGTVSLLASVPLVIFGGDSVILSVIGIICFNMAMPITLHTAAARLSRREGFGFGLTTLALLIGFLVVNDIHLDGLAADLAVAVTGVLAAGAVFLSSTGRSVRK